MDLRLFSDSQKNTYNKTVSHVVQSWEWGEFRKKFVSLQRYGLYTEKNLERVFEVSFHKIPFTSYTVGYLPKGPFPDKQLEEALREVGRKNRCAFIKIEPDVSVSEIKDTQLVTGKDFKPSPKSYFTKHNFILDLQPSEEDLLKKMHPKFRYNIRLAKKHGVTVEERTDDEAFEDYLKLYFETNKRQQFLGHNRKYHETAWQEMKKASMAKLLIAYYKPLESSGKIPLTAWMLFVFKDTLYYPYGGSSNEYRNVMASNLVAWEAIRLGKKLKLKTFDLWGSAKPGAAENDPYYGFTRFKSQLGAKQEEYLGTYDLVLKPLIYYPFTFMDKFTNIKSLILKIIGR